MRDKVYVVEGTHDENKLKSIYKEIKTVSVNGSEISSDSIELLKRLSTTHEIILVLDPDYPGTKIRNELEAIIGDVTHIFFNKQDAISKNKRKVGIEHIDDEIIVKTLKHEIPNIKRESDLSYAFLYEVKILGNTNSKEVRKKISEHFHIGNANGKTLLKRLVWLGLNKKDIIEVLND